MSNEQVTTNELLEFMKENMPTRDELNERIDESRNELLEFMKENMVTKEDAKEFATKDDIFDVNEKIKGLVSRQEFMDAKKEIIGHIDGLVTQYNSHDAEIAALNNRCGRIERHVGMS